MDSDQDSTQTEILNAAGNVVIAYGMGWDLEGAIDALRKALLSRPRSTKREVYATRRRPELDQPNSEAWELEDGEIIQQLTNAEIERRNALLMYRPGEGETKTFRKKSIPAKPQKD